MADQEQRNVEKIAHTELKIEQANALDEFARLETYLEYLFGALVFGSTPKPKEVQKTWLIFWSFQSFRARLPLLSKLIEIEYDDNYDIFFPSLIKMIERINDGRNRIVHWHHMSSSTGGREFNPNTDTCLREPPPGGRVMYKHELIDYSTKARFIAYLTWEFAGYLKHVRDEPRSGYKSWKEIFSEKITYPPSADHPLWRK